MQGRDEAAAFAADCERYWLEAGVRSRKAAEMRQELEAHLLAALDDGRSIRDVVGPNRGAFAEAWAAEQRSDGRVPSWNEVFTTRRRPRGWWDAAIMIGVALLAVVLVAVAGSESEESMVDNEVWRWIWTGAAVFLAGAEIVTAGFFMLPFAGGAVVAAMLAWAGVAPVVQLIVFIAVSIVTLIGLQRFVRHGDEHQPNVGANRFVGQTAMVLESIDRTAGSGRVRMDTEVWRATTDGDPIEAGVIVRVVDVRGARLVVEPAE